MFLKMIRMCAGVALAALLCAVPQQTRAQKKPADDQAIRVNVEMVSLPVVVTTQAGKRVLDLEKEDFRVFEDGVEQTIAGFAATDEPVSVALALDTSGSTELQLANIQNAAIEFVNKLHPDDEVAVLSFAEDTKLQEDFTMNRDKNEYGIKKTRSGGCTVEYEAVWLALDDVLKPVQQRKALVLFTDGVDTCSRKASMGETLDLAKETYATIYCVYYNTESDQYRTGGLGPTVGGLSVPRRRLAPAHRLAAENRRLSGRLSRRKHRRLHGRPQLPDKTGRSSAAAWSLTATRTSTMLSRRSPRNWPANTASATTRATPSTTASSARSKSS